MVRHYDAVAEHLLPALADMLAASASADSRFLALKLTCDTLLPLLLEDQTAQGAVAAAARGRLDRMLRTDLLPLCPALLADDDPIPLYALKLLGGTLEADAGMCGDVVALGLVRRCKLTLD